MSEPQAGFGIPLSENPIVFGYRHGDGQPENFSMTSGEQAEMQRAACSDAAMLREVPKAEWELNGFEIVSYEGQGGSKVKSLVRAFDKTAQLLAEQKAREDSIEDAAPETQFSMEEKLASQQEQISELLEIVKAQNSEATKGKQATEAKLAADTAKAKEHAKK